MTAPPNRLQIRRTLKAPREPDRENHDKGWRSCLDSLAEYLSA